MNKTRFANTYAMEQVLSLVSLLALTMATTLKGCFAYFIAEPVDKKVCVGETTSFKCISSHVLSIPVWIINGTSYNWSQPPRHHEYDHKTRSLIVTNVTEFMNGTTYQCVISNDGLSAVGKLHVKPPMAATEPSPSVTIPSLGTSGIITVTVISLLVIALTVSMCMLWKYSKLNQTRSYRFRIEMERIPSRTIATSHHDYQCQNSLTYNQLQRRNTIKQMEDEKPNDLEVTSKNSDNNAPNYHNIQCLSTISD